MNLPKKILVIYFSQSGQLENIVKQLTSPLQAQGHHVFFHKIEPLVPFPFPWTSDEFFSAFPDSFNERCFPVMSMEGKDLDFDLIILGYSPWFLSPSIPTSSFLQSKQGREILNGKKVITIIGCRNMWIQAQEKIKKQLSYNHALLVGNIVLRDKNPNLISVLTIIRWLIHGKKRKSFFLPAAGISAIDVKESDKFGILIHESLNTGNYDGLQQRLNEKKAVEIFSNLMLFEKNGNRIFSMWAKKIQNKKLQEDSKKLLWIRVFKYYLITVLFVISPIGSLIYFFIKPFIRRSIQKKKIYYSSNECTFL